MFLQVYIGMLSALEAVHKAGIAHRDVKPGLPTLQLCAVKLHLLDSPGGLTGKAMVHTQ